MHMLLTSTVLTEGLKVTQPWTWFKRVVLARSAASQLQLNALWAPPPMLIGELFAETVKTLALCLLYAPLYPPLYLLTAASLLVSFTANKCAAAACCCCCCCMLHGRARPAGMMQAHDASICPARLMHRRVRPLHCLLATLAAELRFDLVLVGQRAHARAPGAAHAHSTFHMTHAHAHAHAQVGDLVLVGQPTAGRRADDGAAAGAPRHVCTRNRTRAFRGTAAKMRRGVPTSWPHSHPHSHPRQHSRSLRPHSLRHRWLSSSCCLCT